MRATLRLALAAALIALSSVARAEKVTLVCEPTKSESWGTQIFEIDYDRSTITWAGATVPVRVTAQEISWSRKGEVTQEFKINRITAVFWTRGCYGTQCREDEYRCRLGKPVF